ncbi:unnamed protein product [Leuciscus chuanchicus]
MNSTSTTHRLEDETHNHFIKGCPYTLSRLVASSSLSESSTTKQVKRYTGSDEAEHTVWPSRNESGRPLISAPLPMRANSSQLLPSRPLLQINSGPQWRLAVLKGLYNFEETFNQQSEEKQLRRKARRQTFQPASEFTYRFCGRDSTSQIGLLNHNRHCTSDPNLTPVAICFWALYRPVTLSSDPEPKCWSVANANANRH